MKVRRGLKKLRTYLHYLQRPGDGKALIIDRDYIQQGMRHVAEHEATLLLRQAQEAEFRKGIERNLEARRITQLDREPYWKSEQGVKDKLIEAPLLSFNAREWRASGENR